MLHGELNQIKEDNPLLFKNISLTNKLGFPDVIMPGDVRNDLYLTLEKGEFERGGKSTGKNIEVTVVVLDSEKNIIKVIIIVKMFFNWLWFAVVVLELFMGRFWYGWRIWIQFHDYLSSQLTGVGRKCSFDLTNWQICWSSCSFGIQTLFK